MNILGASDIGSVCEENQDDFAYKLITENEGFALVCDGMGGANGGAVASRIAVSLIAERILSSFRQDMTAASLENVLESAVAAANIEIFDRGAADLSLRGMGTTLVGAVIHGGEAHVVHVGDSRAYLYRDGTLCQLTSDHSYVQDMVDQGKMTPEQARSDPRKHIITRALGVDESVQMDLDTVPFSEPGELLLLCSDGLTNMVETDEIQHLIETTPFVQLPETLVQAAISHGGADNITVVAVLE